MHALLLLAAGEAKPSKVLFYVAGGLLAGWAVVLSALGLNRPDFPTSSGAARGVMGISVALVAFAMVAVIVVA